MALCFLGEYNSNAYPVIYGDDEPHSEEDGKVSIFAGEISSEKEFEDYFFESISSEENSPQNLFCIDFIIEDGYDLDFSEALCTSGMALEMKCMPVVEFQKLAEKLSYYKSFSTDLQDSAKEKKLKKVNSITALYNFNYENIKPAKNVKAKHKIEFLGTFDFSVN